MFATLILAAALGASPQDAVSIAPKPDLGAYSEATARAGKTGDAQVRLALWCEAHGLTAERLKHLSLAVLYEPAHPMARGLMGLVAYRGRWERPEQVSLEVQDDPAHKARIKEYLQRRVHLSERADDHWKLAIWCEQNGLKEQAIAHLHQVLRLDPRARARGSTWATRESAGAGSARGGRGRQGRGAAAAEGEHALEADSREAAQWPSK